MFRRGRGLGLAYLLAPGVLADSQPIAELHALDARVAHESGTVLTAN